VRMRPAQTVLPLETSRLQNRSHTQPNPLPVSSDISCQSEFQARTAAGEVALRGRPLDRTIVSRYVLQLQRQYGNHYVQRALSANTLSRQPHPDKPAEKADAPKREAEGPQQQLFVVRDARLRLGGTLVSDLEALKDQLMASKLTGKWTLVIAMHGSEELLGAQSPPDWKKNAKFYKASDIERLFNSDKAFVKWRNQYGPSHLSMASCQVDLSFERTLIDNLTRAGSDQKAQGLGKGCKPISTAEPVPGAPSTRALFDRLPDAERNEILRQLRILNDKWGYYGAPPVPTDQLAHYYYDEEPKGEWVRVEVMVGEAHQVEGLKSTGIAFWNRASDPNFFDACKESAANWREHVPSVPDVP
jgi:hypothetical protein